MKMTRRRRTKEILIGKDELTIGDLVTIARHNAKVRLAKTAKDCILRARALIEKWVQEGKIIYGITTGFGALSDINISKKDLERLQKNILMSHAAGVGDPLDEEIVRAIMAIRINDLSKGYSGIRYETVNHLLALLNGGIYPVVPKKGSVGASGDLAPTAHLGLVLIGQGEAFYRAKRMSGKKALSAIGLSPLRLEAGEGLALINGTQVMTAIAALVIHDAVRLSKMADIACAMSLEVLMGSDAEFDPRIHRVRPHQGQSAAADNMRRITRNSDIIHSHEHCARIQDAYTLRCSPQIHGASKDACTHVKHIVETEINSTTTNPLVFPETEDFLLGGNFHGQPIALATDYLAMAIAELGNVSERRVERLVNPQLSELPAFLVRKGGLNSGYMIAQYTAAALVSENKVLCHPASIDSIPTSANKEDHVSMGTISARKCRSILDNTEYVIAVELLCAAQAMDLLPQSMSHVSGEGTREAYKAIREKISFLDKDRILSRDIETMVSLLRNEEIVRRVEGAVGELK
jgi:histidine ammonia-lyase